MSKLKNILAIIIFFLGIGVIYFVILIKDLPNPNQFGQYQVIQSTKIYDRTGKILLYEIHGEEKRTIIPLSEISDYVKWATLVAEDVDFYKHPAFNIKSILRALITNIKTGQFSQGGSTITQQLAKNLFLSPEKTLKRKLKEIILALQLESIYTKDQILELYLNQIPYGSNSYGIESASKTFFNKSAKDLNLAEAALLASLPKAPTYYSPWGNHQKELFERQKNILNRMYEYKFISKEELEKALEETLKIKFAQPNKGVIKAPHFVLTVKDILIKKYGEEIVEKGGLKVITTLDWEIQEIAEKVVEEGVKKNEELYQGSNATLVAQDPKTGQILALVGSKNWYEEEPKNCKNKNSCGFEPKFNVVTQGLRQPGSALKPFVYLTAFKKGYPPQTIIMDVPTEFTAGDKNCPAIITPQSQENKNCFNPQNFDDKFRGPVSFETALAQSINVPAVKVLYLVGLKDTLKTLNDFGITTLKEYARYGLSLVLGGGEVKPIELVNAYSILANDGIKHKQNFILRVEDNQGNVLESFKDDYERIIDAQFVRLINQILISPELRSGLFQNSLNLTIFPGYEVALKTGTTNDYRDAWAFGYTPFLTVGVWAGNNNNEPMQKHAGSILAAIPIWSEFLNKVIYKFEPETFPKPEPVPLPNKPMLNGQAIAYINNKPQVHSILYYVNRNDPLGPLPQNPYLDFQFYNWEIAVNHWINNNLSYLSSYLPTGTTYYQTSTKITKRHFININFNNVKNGDFIQLPFKLETDLKASAGLNTIELYLNNRLIEKRYITGSSYRYHYTFYNLKPQNSIEIKVIDLENNTQSKSITVFR